MANGDKLSTGTILKILSIVLTIIGAAVGYGMLQGDVSTIKREVQTKSAEAVEIHTTLFNEVGALKIDNAVTKEQYRQILEGIQEIKQELKDKRRK